jgi:hypothetical protein
MIRKTYLIGLTLFVITLNSCDYCCVLVGDNKLGDKLTLLEGDRLEDRIIVYCNRSKREGCCYSGSYFLPLYEDHYFKDKRGYREYIKQAKYNDNYVIAQSVLVEDQTMRYWIIDKDFDLEGSKGSEFDSIIKAHTYGEFDSITFYKKLEELKINLTFK